MGKAKRHLQRAAFYEMLLQRFDEGEFHLVRIQLRALQIHHGRNDPKDKYSREYQVLQQKLDEGDLGPVRLALQERQAHHKARYQNYEEKAALAAKQAAAHAAAVERAFG